VDKRIEPATDSFIYLLTLNTATAIRSIPFTVVLNGFIRGTFLFESGFSGRVGRAIAKPTKELKSIKNL